MIQVSKSWHTIAATSEWSYGRMDHSAYLNELATVNTELPVVVLAWACHCLQQSTLKTCVLLRHKYQSVIEAFNRQCDHCQPPQTHQPPHTHQPPRIAQVPLVPLPGESASSAGADYRLQIWDSHAGSPTARSPFAGPAPALQVHGLQFSLCRFCAFCLSAICKQEVGWG